MRTALLLIGLSALLGGCAPAPQAENPPAEQGLRYSNPEAGFSLTVPEGILVNPASITSREDQTSLFIEATRVDDLDGPGLHSKEDAQENMAALAKEEFGPNVDFLLDTSRAVVPLGSDTHAKQYMTLGRFEVCDIAFDRVLLFYRNGYQVIITLRGPVRYFVDAMPQYFYESKENCGEGIPIWNFEAEPPAHDQFYRALTTGNVPQIVRDWDGMFDAIVTSIRLE
ncbi:MAG: hypothetical protein PHO92_00540 [Candidatus Peribacteraceae bacterium]|nr:hypothetical protein [Candidatus Peribacteraceae bacterium]